MLSMNLLFFRLEAVQEKTAVYIEHSIVNYSTVSSRLQLGGQPRHTVLFLLPAWITTLQVSLFTYRTQALCKASG